MPIFKIYESKKEALEEAVAKLAKRAAKLHVAPITFDVRDFVDVEVKTPLGISFLRRVYNVEVTGEAPVIAGWKLLGIIKPLVLVPPTIAETVAGLRGITATEQPAVLAATEAFYVTGIMPDDVPSNLRELSITAARKYAAILNIQAHAHKFILNAVPGCEVPELYKRDPQDFCDQCHTANKGRVKLYILGHESGAFAQVGSSCLRDFLGHKSPEALAAWAEEMADFVAACEESEDEEDDFRGGGHSYFRIPLLDFLAVSAMNVRRHGWVPKSKSDISCPSTADRVDMILTCRRPEPEDKPQAVDFERAETVIAWVREDLASRSRLSDYESNVVAACASETVEPSAFGVLASAIGVWQRENEQRLASPDKASVWQGQEKQRLPLAVECIMVREVPGFAGPFDDDPPPAYFMKLRDVAGNVYTWTTGTAELELGQWYKGKGTVVKHEVFRGINQTKLNRCRLEQCEPPTAEGAQA